jgi:hypothetical protein
MSLGAYYVNKWYLCYILAFDLHFISLYVMKKIKTELNIFVCLCARKWRSNALIQSLWGIQGIQSWPLAFQALRLLRINIFTTGKCLLNTNMCFVLDIWFGSFYHIIIIIVVIISGSTDLLRTLSASHQTFRNLKTLSRTPLDEWSARRKGLYLQMKTTQRQTPVPRAGFEPTISVTKRPRPTPYTAVFAMYCYWTHVVLTL